MALFSQKTVPTHPDSATMTPSTPNSANASRQCHDDTPTQRSPRVPTLSNSATMTPSSPQCHDDTPYPQKCQRLPTVSRWHSLAEGTVPMLSDSAMMALLSQQCHNDTPLTEETVQTLLDSATMALSTPRSANASTQCHDDTPRLQECQHFPTVP